MRYFESSYQRLSLSWNDEDKEPMIDMYKDHLNEQLTGTFLTPPGECLEPGDLLVDLI